MILKREKSREIMTHFIRSDGVKFPVYILKVEDLKGLDFSSSGTPYKICAKALGISESEFDEWDLFDGIKIAELIEQQVKVMK
jgi:hypothetical protein